MKEDEFIQQLELFKHLESLLINSIIIDNINGDNIILKSKFSALFRIGKVLVIVKKKSLRIIIKKN